MGTGGINQNIVNIYMGLRYHTLIEKIEDESGVYYVATHPDFEGCVADGESPQEAYQELQDVRREMIAALLENDIPVPYPAMEIQTLPTTRARAATPTNIAGQLVSRQDGRGDPSANNSFPDAIWSARSGS